MRTCYNLSHMALRVSLFVTCIVDQLFPKVGMAMAEVLERAGHVLLAQLDEAHRVVDGREVIIR